MVWKEKPLPPFPPKKTVYSLLKVLFERIILHPSLGIFFLLILFFFPSFMQTSLKELEGRGFIYLMDIITDH